MNRLAPLLIAFFSVTVAYATGEIVIGGYSIGAPKAETYQLENGKREFQYFEKMQWVVSQPCELKVKTKCQAALALLGADELMGKGAQICRLRHKGELVAGYRENAGQVVFCKFSDGSLASLGSLESAAQFNTRRRKPGN